MAKVSESVAVSCVELVAKGVAGVADLEERPERVIGCLGDYESPDPQPSALAVSSYMHYQLDDLPLPDACDDIRSRVEACGEPVGFSFGQDEADAARSYGCLLEIKHDRFCSSAFITDTGFIADRVRLQLTAAASKQTNEATQEPASKHVNTTGSLNRLAREHHHRPPGRIEFLYPTRLLRAQIPEAARPRAAGARARPRDPCRSRWLLPFYGCARPGGSCAGAAS